MIQRNKLGLKLFLPLVEQGVQWSRERFHGAREGQVTFSFHHYTRHSLNKYEEGGKILFQKSKVTFR